MMVADKGAAGGHKLQSETRLDNQNNRVTTVVVVVMLFI